MIKWSHSKLNTIMSCPMSYYLSYKQGISLKVEKTALSVGSAVHYGIEHNTDDLTNYFHEVLNTDEYTENQILAESMVTTYLKNKDNIFNSLLSTYEGESLDLLDMYPLLSLNESLYDSLTDEEKQNECIYEKHELYLNSKFQSYSDQYSHLFVGIIDLLLLTEKGWIIIDYKTSSNTPNWDDYLDQLYRYIYLLNYNFPDIPVYKIGIINLKKAKLRQGKKETYDTFLRRIKLEYEETPDNYIDWHIFNPKDLNQDFFNQYIENLSKELDIAEMIDINGIWFINYQNAKNVYGKSQFWDIFYNTPNAEVLYKINDYLWDEELNDFVKSRDCLALDMKVINNNNVLNKFDQFKANAITYYTVHEDMTKKSFFDYLKKNYIVNDDLLEKYYITLLKVIEIEKKLEIE